MCKFLCVEGINFTWVTVMFNSVSNSGYICKQGRMRIGIEHTGQRKLEHVTKQREDQEENRMKEVYPQCSKCLYHFYSKKLLEKHICCGAMMPIDVLSTAMRHANGLLIIW